MTVISIRDHSKQVGTDTSWVCLFVFDPNRLILNLGIYVCTNGTQNGQCLSASESGSTPNVTTAFSISSYTASSINSAKNNSILSVFDLVTQEAISPIDVQALGLAVGWLLNYTSADLPVETSPDFQFWDTGSDAYQAVWETNAYTTLKSILGFVFWEFTANNNGNPVVSNTEPNGQTPVLPAEFYTTASICMPFARLVIDRAAFIAYIVLQSVALIFCWVVVLWGVVIHRQLPATTSFPVVDFGAKLRRMQNIDERLFSKVGREDGAKEIRHCLQEVRVTSRCEAKPEDIGLLAKEERINYNEVRRRASWS